MNVLIARGNDGVKTGSLRRGEIARERGHEIRVAASAMLRDNLTMRRALTCPEKLRHVDVGDRFHHTASCHGKYRGLRRRGQEHGGRNHRLVRRSGQSTADGREERAPVFFTARIFRSASICFSRRRRTAAGILQHQYSGQIFERHHAQKKMRLRELQRPCRRYPRHVRQANWKSLRSVKATWSACTRSCWIRPTTQFISATTPSRAADLPRARCGQRSGWLERRASSTSRIFGRET